MARETLKNVGASVRARLLQRSRDKRTDFQILLTRYALERLLYRLSRRDGVDLGTATGGGNRRHRIQAPKRVATPRRSSAISTSRIIPRARKPSHVAE
jgi:hypothetical protein